MCWKTEVESLMRTWHSVSQTASEESELRVTTNWSMILEVSSVLRKPMNDSCNYPVSHSFFQSFERMNLVWNCSSMYHYFRTAVLHQLIV